MAARSARLSWRRLIEYRLCLSKSQCHEVAKKHLERRNFHSTYRLLNDNGVNITEGCVKQLRKVLDKSEFLRIVIEGGGCSGFQYKFEIDTDIQDDDKTFNTDGGKIVIDADSLHLIEGSTIDFRQELIKSSFVVLKNPNADKGCSCGSSFSIKI